MGVGGIWKIVVTSVKIMATRCNLQMCILFPTDAFKARKK